MLAPGYIVTCFGVTGDGTNYFGATIFTNMTTAEGLSVTGTKTNWFGATYFTNGLYADGVNVTNVLLSNQQSNYAGTLRVTNFFSSTNRMDMAEITNSLNVGGASRFTNNVAVEGTLQVGGASRFTNNVAVQGTLQTGGMAHFTNNVSIAGDLYVNAKGNITNVHVGSIVTSTNSFAQAVDFNNKYGYTNATANITFEQNMTGVVSTNRNWCERVINANGADRTITVPASWNIKGGGTTITATNGTFLHLLITAQEGAYTNVLWEHAY